MHVEGKIIIAITLKPVHLNSIHLNTGQYRYPVFKWLSHMTWWNIWIPDILDNKQDFFGLVFRPTRVVRYSDLTVYKKNGPAICPQTDGKLKTVHDHLTLLIRGLEQNFKMYFSLYSRDPNTKHLNFGNIQIPDFLDLSIWKAHYSNGLNYYLGCVLVRYGIQIHWEF